MVLKDQIKICFGLHDRDGSYTCNVGIVMQSIMDHTKHDVEFYVLVDDSVSDENRALLYETAVDGGAALHIVPVDASQFNSLNTGKFTVGTLYRLSIPQLLPDLSKVIYLDADLVVAADIYELWTTDIQDYAFAAAPDDGWPQDSAVVKMSLVPVDRYVNTGVLVINLDMLRKDGSFTAKCVDFLQEAPHASLFDQDAINALYWKQIKLVDQKWNRFTIYNKNVETAIYHYAASAVNLYRPKACDDLLVETVLRTPWGFDFLKPKYHHTMNTLTDKCTQMQALIKKLSDSDVRFAYYGRESWPMRSVMEFLPPRESDFFLQDSAKKNPTFRNLPVRTMDDLKEMDPKKLLILAEPTDGYQKDWDTFEQLGFRNGRDYFCVARLVDRDHGGYI